MVRMLLYLSAGLVTPWFMAHDLLLSAFCGISAMFGSLLALIVPGLREYPTKWKRIFADASVTVVCAHLLFGPTTAAADVVTVLAQTGELPIYTLYAATIGLLVTSLFSFVFLQFTFPCGLAASALVELIYNRGVMPNNRLEPQRHE